MINNVMLEGRIVKDIELKGNDNKFISNTIAVYGGKDKDGNAITHFIDFKAFSKNAEKLFNQCQKGSKIVIQGDLRVEKWEKEQTKYSKVVVYISQFVILANNKNEASDETDAMEQTLEDDERDLPF